MKTIKTKNHVEGIKTLDKIANLSTRAKNAYIRTKENVVELNQSKQSSPTEYATDSSQNMTNIVVNESSIIITKIPKNAIKIRIHTEKLKEASNNAIGISNNVNKTAEYTKHKYRKAQIEGQQTINEVKHNPISRSKFNTSSGNVSDKYIKKLVSTQNTHKTSTKGYVKSINKSVKTAERTTRLQIKTANRTAKIAQKTTKAAVKSAKVAEKTTRVVVKTTVKAAKFALKATIAIVKALIAAVKGLVTAIATGGWVAVVIILVVCMTAILIGSVFGIFFSGEASPETGMIINNVISDIDEEFTEFLSLIITNNPHDLLDMSGSKALWKHVLAIYTVMTVTDPDNPMEVATMNEVKAQILRNVFWDMNTIIYEVVQYDIEVDILDDDELPTGEIVIETINVLCIRIARKTNDEISTQYGFNEEQKEWLEELLKPEYHVLWNALLYGITSIGDGSMIEIAETQIGNIGGEPYWRWYGFSSRVPWCACFVSWVADQAGFIEAGIIPRFSSCVNGIAWFKIRGQWQEPGYTPTPGDIIFFDWQSDGLADHVGIVERVEGGIVHTIEGNSSDSVRRRSYRLDSNRIFGYGIPLYR